MAPRACALAPEEEEVDDHSGSEESSDEESGSGDNGRTTRATASTATPCPTTSNYFLHCCSLKHFYEFSLRFQTPLVAESCFMGVQPEISTATGYVLVPSLVAVADYTARASFCGTLTCCYAVLPIVPGLSQCVNLQWLFTCSLGLAETT